MGNRVWYEAWALMANATSHHHVFLVASSEEAEQRIRNRYPHAVTILVRQGYPWTKRKESRMQL
jgi:UDP-N-acetyl-D-mannosaminuronic acid transferase (WecB/TagA/CpsF family)